MTELPTVSQDRPEGLRERKKARTRAAIREHALRLFREQGYQRTTVEQIAAAAEVSPSTFFRYFPTKEDLVLQDDMDTRMVEAFERQPPGLGPVAAVRGAIREALESYNDADLDVIRQTTALTMTVPEVRARAMDEFGRTIAVISEALAKRAGRPHLVFISVVGADRVPVVSAVDRMAFGYYAAKRGAGPAAPARAAGLKQPRPFRAGARPPAGSGPGRCARTCPRWPAGRWTSLPTAW